MNIPKHPIQTPAQAFEFLTTIVKTLPKRCQELCNVVLYDPRFTISPAAKSHHQNWTGGLVVHESQVLWSALELVKNVPGANLEFLTCGVVFHDYGKCWDYATTDQKPTIRSRWEVTPHCNLIYHLPRSYSELMIANFKRKLYTEEEIQQIGHIVLASHGRLEWQSPVEPCTLLAWAAHSGDMISSRYTETDRPIT